LYGKASLPSGTRNPPATLASIARYCSPTPAEVAQWYRLASRTYTQPQLAALGISCKIQSAIAKGEGVQPARTLWRSIWLAYSYAYAPANLASPYAWATWGRFNPENQDTADLLARRWAEHNKKKKPQPWKRKRQSPARPAGEIHPASQQFYLPPL